MAKEERVSLIKQIEAERGTKVLTYITSTRQNHEVRMSIDVIRKFYEHLKTIEDKERGKIKIDLLIVSNGGDGTVPWRLVTLIREFAKEFNVLIPYRAFSAATLTALGANNIVMHSMGMLGPTDPTVSNSFNPDDPKTSQKMGISVEDVTAYISLIKEDVGIRHEDELIQAFNALSDKVHPLALGNVKRSLSQSKMMAQKLLSLHMNKAQEQHEIDEIVNNLTSKLYYHGHPINRREAKDQIGLKNVVFADPKLENLMWDLYLEYEREIKAEEPFDPLMEFVAHNPQMIADTNATHNLDCKIAFIESATRTDYCIINYEIFGTKMKNGSYQIIPNIIARGWKTE